MKKTATALALFLGSVASSYGSIILLSPTEQSGTGLGSVNTVLTLNGANGYETGCVGVVGGATSTTGCGQPDNTVQAQNGTPTLAAIGATAAADIRIVFNASEPGNARDIQLNALTLTLYNTSGSASSSYSLAAPVYFPTSASGTGNSGYVFGLDAPQAVAAQSFINSNGTASAVRVGLAASVGCGTTPGAPACIGTSGGGAATGGLETFFVQGVADVPGGGGSGGQVPEPSSMLMLAGGLGAVIAYARRR